MLLCTSNLNPINSFIHFVPNTLMKNIFYNTLLLILLYACGSNSSAPATEAKIEVQAETTVIPDTLSSVFFRKYSGNIGDLPIVIDLARNQEKISGTYYYKNIGVPIALEGDINSDGSFNVKEYGNGSVTGIFEGVIPAKGNITGFWYNAKKSKSLPLNLIEITEGFAQVAFDERKAKNCKFAKEAQQLEIAGSEDGCTTLNIEFLKVNTPTTEISTKINSTLISNIIDASESGNKFNDIDQFMKIVNIQTAEDGFNGEVSCNVLTNGNNTLSVGISTNWFSFGAAHGMYNTEYINFNLSTGNIVQLEELLKPGFEGPLNRIAEANFVKEYGTEGWEFEPGNFSLNRNFSIQPGGLLFQFSPYEIGAFSSGTPAVFVNYKSISNWIQPKGLLAGWLQ